MSLALQSENFQHIVRLLNTNVEGKRKVPFALRMVKGIGIRFAYMVCKKAGIDVERRAGTLTPEELERVSEVIADPGKFKIPEWFFNRQRDPKSGKTEHLTSSMVDTRLREDLERLRKNRVHRGVRHAYGLRVRGQHTCTSGRHGKTVGVSRSKKIDSMSLALQSENFQHIVRLLNTNVEGKRKVPFALRMVKGIGIRFAYMVCKKAGIDVERRAGTLTPEELERVSEVIADPGKFKIPEWFFNRQRDPKSGKTEHLTSSMVDTRLREDLERLRKNRVHRGVRHAYGLRVRGQHTCTSGRHGKTVGVSRSK